MVMGCHHNCSYIHSYIPTQLPCYPNLLSGPPQLARLKAAPDILGTRYHPFPTIFDLFFLHAAIMCSLIR